MLEQRKSRRGRAIAVAAWVALATHAAAQAPVPSPRPGLPHAFTLTPGIHLPGALQQVAYRLFAPPPGTLLTIDKVHDHPRPHDNADFQKYVVTDRNGGAIGEFIRMRVHHGAETALDVALRLEDGRVAHVAPLRPVVLSGAPVLDFERVLEPFKATKARDYGAPLASLFHALDDLDRVAAGKADTVIPREQAVQAVKALQVANPPPPVGTAIPAFDAVDEKGGRFTPARLAGRPALVVMATLQSAVGRDVLDWVHRYSAAAPERFAVFEVILNRQPAIDQYRRRGGQFTGVVVPDAGLRVYSAFKPALSPCLYVYDANGALALEMSPPFTNFEDMKSRLDAVR